MISHDVEIFFNELYESTHKKVLAYIIIKCGKTEDIADIFQETYTELVSVIRRHGVEYLKNPEAFVMKLAKRKVYRHYKLLERLRGVEASYELDESDMDAFDMETISFEDSFMTKELVSYAIDFIKQKDELTKRIFYLHFYLDKSIREIAEMISITESNVKNKLYRTLKELKEYLMREGMV
ncbi:MAG: RNA polymerase sigma factor [Lachnospiraceae bacterium]|nr:RNA polymerase sigma factor [Lachnospiraceae bacterium]